MLKKFFRNMFEFVAVVLTIAAMLFWILAVGKVVEPLWPLVTTVFVSACTAGAIRKRGAAAVIAIAGIVLYVAGWLLMGTIAPYFCTAVSGLGVFVWAVAVMRSIAGRDGTSMVLRMISGR
ncbi:MAG TPA: hypothetical protein VF803_03265 [Candidatus Paceibacterota bacterium]